MDNIVGNFTELDNTTQHLINVEEIDILTLYPSLIMRPNVIGNMYYPEPSTADNKESGTNTSGDDVANSVISYDDMPPLEENPQYNNNRKRKNSD